MTWRNRNRSEKARKIVEGLKRKSKKSLGRYVLVRAAKAVGALAKR